MKKVIVGQDSIIDKMLICLLCEGHILLEGLPGLAKTTLIKTFAQVLGLDFQRIQFTPDLLPSDIIGTLIYNPKLQEFQTKKGPLFANLILADEINRAPAKVQSALLEAMQERQVTLGDVSYTIERPFLVMATQNPIEQEGTYKLPEAQLDRFMFKVIMHHPHKEEEKEIIKRTFNPHHVIKVLNKKEIHQTQEDIRNIYVDDRIIDYITSIVFATREPQNYKLGTLKSFIEHGASPRGSLALYNASRAYAFLKKRHFVIPDDVKMVAPDVLQHRILLSYEAEADNITSQHVIEKILEVISTP
jgi:MoxR-like ATPase